MTQEITPETDTPSRVKLIVGRVIFHASVGFLGVTQATREMFDVTATTEEPPEFNLPEQRTIEKIGGVALAVGAAGAVIGLCFATNTNPIDVMMRETQRTWR